jgi:hypothetical protein
MKQLTRDPSAASKAREAEKNDSELKSINLSLSSASSGPVKKKPVFKSTLQPHNVPAAKGQLPGVSSSDGKDVDMDTDDAWLEEWNADPQQMKANGWEADRYDHRYVCGYCPRCRGTCQGHAKDIIPGESLEDYEQRRQPRLDALMKMAMAIPGARELSLQDFGHWDERSFLSETRLVDGNSLTKKVKT